MALSEAEELEYLQLKKRKNSAIGADVAQNSGIANRIGQGLKKAAEIPYAAGGKVADVVSSMGAPPEVAGGLGYGANVALQSIPMLVGGEAAKLGGEAAAVPLKSMARMFMRSALKPAKAARRTGKGEKAVETLLDEGVNVSRGGIDDIKDKLTDLGTELKNVIASSDKTGNKHEVANYLQDVIKKFENDPDSIGAQRAVEEAWTKFINHPKLAGKDDIPIQTLQDLKTGFQKSVGDKGYGDLKTPATESEKALARGMREKILELEPTTGPILKREADLINALKLVQSRVSAEGNNNIVGLGPLAPNTPAFAAFLADKWGLSKSVVARALNMMSKGVPGFAADTARSGIALSEIHNQVGRQ